MDNLTLVVILSAIVSVVSAVVAVFFSSKTQTGELEADVEELALLVERMGKAQRREKMARVRQGAQSAETPQEAPQAALDYESDPKARKAALRRRLINRGTVQ